METNIITQVARKVFFKNTKVPVELQESHGVVSASDSISLSRTAQNISSMQNSGGQFEMEHAAHVEQLKQKLQSNNYDIDKHVIEGIAEKIATMFA